MKSDYPGREHPVETRVGLGNDSENVASGDSVPDADIHAIDDSSFRCLDGLFHFHSLEDAHKVTGDDRISEPNQDFDNGRLHA